MFPELSRVETLSKNFNIKNLKDVKETGSYSSSVSCSSNYSMGGSPGDVSEEPVT